MKKTRQKAFTLIEMLVVVVIIGIILAIVISSATNLLNNRSKKAYKIHVDLVESATKTYIDQYKGQLANDTKSECYNIDYNTLLSDGLLKESDIKCNGNIIITKGINNNFQSDFYFSCVDDNNDKVNTSTKVPSGCKGFNGKFKMEYAVYEDNNKQVVYDGNKYIKDAYVYFTSTSPYGANIDHFEYTTTLDGIWTKINANTNLGTIDDIKNFVGTLYVRSVDTDDNVSSSVEIPVMMDNKGPSFNTSVSGNWLTKKINISNVSDPNPGIKTLAEKAYSFDGGTTWIDKMEQDFEENKIVNVCARDILGNKTCKDVTVSGIDRVVPNKPSIAASDKKGTGTWHTTKNLTLTLSLSGEANISGNTFYYGNSIKEVEEKKNSGTTITISDETTSKTYYYNVCSGSGFCSEIGSYEVKLDKTTPSIKTVAGASTTWSGSDRKFTLTNNSAISGIESAYYYVSNSTTAPSSSTTGTKCSSATSCTVGTGKYVFFRIVNGAKVSSSWTAKYDNYVDKDKPEITSVAGASTTWSGSNRTFTLTNKAATSGIANAYYYVSNSTTTPSSSTAGTKCSSATSCTVGTGKYVFFRIVNGLGVSSDWKGKYDNYVDTVIPPTPSLAVSDNIGSNNWHNKDFNITSSGGNNISGNTYHYGTSVAANSTNSNKAPFSDNTTAVTYYFKVCSGAGLCSETPASYVVKLDKSVPTVTAKNASNYITTTTGASITSYFNITGVISGNTTVCKVGSTTVTNTNNLGLGTNTVTCTSTSGSGLSSSASTVFKHQYVATATCASGYTLSGSTCTKSENYAATANNKTETIGASYACSGGRTLSNGNCTYYYTSNADKCGTTPEDCNCWEEQCNCTDVCVGGNEQYTYTGTCTRNGTCTSTTSHGCNSCNSQGKYSNFNVTSSTSSNCDSGGNCTLTCKFTYTESCQKTGTKWNDCLTTTKSCQTCKKCNTCYTPNSCTKTENEYRYYTCSSGYTLSGSQCSRQVFSHYSCPSGGTLSGSTCLKSSSVGVTYVCPSGGSLSGTTCSF